MDDARTGIVAPLRRVADARFLTGAGSHIDDPASPNGIWRAIHKKK